MSATGAAALEYARRGLPVLPLHTPDEDGRCSCGRECATPGKHPRTQHGVKDATSDEATIRRWWSMWPEAGVAIRMGAGRVALDVDHRSGGDATLESLQAADGRELPDTARVATGGGFHLHFKAPPGTPSRTLAPGVELKGEGSYVVAPPSMHPSGKEYTWVDDVEPAQAPAWLLEDATRRRNGAAAPVEGRIPEGERNTTLTSIAGTMRRRGMGADEIEAALKVANEQRCDPALPPDEVRRIAESVERYPPAEGSGAPVTFDSRTGAPITALELLRRDFPELTGPNEIVRVVKLGGKESSYVLELAGEETVELGTAKQVLKPRDVQGAIFDATGVAIPVQKADAWREVAQRLHAAAEVREVSLDERDETRDWVDHFVRQGVRYSHVLRNPDAARKLENLRQPDPESFVEGEVAYIRLAHLRQHIVMYRREQPISTKALSERLGRIGYRPRQPSERDPETDKVLKARFYVGPWGGS